MEGTKEDIRIYDGWEKSTVDMKETAERIKALLDIKSTDKVLEIPIKGIYLASVKRNGTGYQRWNVYW